MAASDDENTRQPTITLTYCERCSVFPSGRWPLQTSRLILGPVRRTISGLVASNQGLLIFACADEFLGLLVLSGQDFRFRSLGD